MPQELPWYLALGVIGFDDEGGDSEDNDSEEEESEEEESDDSGDQEGQRDNTALLSALRKERKDRRLAERELKKLQRERKDADDQEQADSKQLKEERDTERSKSEKLAKRLRDNELDNRIMRFAGDQFADLEDVLKLLDRSNIDVDQDDDDPSDIDIDDAQVKAAVSALAKTKPHLLKVQGEDTKTGGQFGGGKKGKEGLEEEHLKSLYPALRRV